MKVFLLYPENDRGGALVLPTMKALQEGLREIGPKQYLDNGDKWTIEVTSMTRKEFDELPEHGGF